MKSMKHVGLGVLALYCLPNEKGGSAEVIMPFPFEGGVAVDQSSGVADENLCGEVTVTLFETEAEMDAFYEGLDLANPGDDYTWQKYEIEKPVEGCSFIVVYHYSDAPSELSVRKYVS